MQVAAYTLSRLLAFWTVSVIATSQAPQVTIANGTLRGSTNAELQQDVFLGIPYAQPPVEKLRFQKPRALDKAWDGIRPASQYGAFCRNVPVNLPGFTQTGFQFQHSEDCLTLNIIRPSCCTHDYKYPVLFWIHGGGLQDGGSGDPRYNMSFVVEESVRMGKPIIGVSINCRLTGWGFLGGRALNESGNTNLGLQDQRLALRWVQENIAAFGGDPTKITLQGESSGALSVGYHLLAYGGKNDGLFRAAIAQSGIVNPNGPLTLDEQDVVYETVLNATGCLTSSDSLSCLRAAPVAKLDDAFSTLAFNPVIDGGLVPGTQSHSLREGKFSKVPLVVGTNKNEGTSVGSLTARSIDNLSQFTAFVKGLDSIGGLKDSTAQELAEIYNESLPVDQVKSLLGTVKARPNSTFGSLYGQATIYLGDYLFNAGKRFSAYSWSQYGVPAYTYRFDVVPNGVPPDVLGATHFQEVAFVFKNFVGGGYDINPFASESIQDASQLQQLSTQMTRMWISFVNDLTPNNYGPVPTISNVVWPEYKIQDPKNIVFQVPKPIIEPDLDTKEGVARIIKAFDELRV